MKSVNSLHLIGNLGQDPEIRATTTGKRVASLSLATTDGWGDHEKTNWHRLKVFGKLVDVVEQWVKKGDRLYVRGHVSYSTSEYEGEKKYWTDIIVDDLVMLGGKGERDELADGSSRESNRFATEPF